MTTTKAKTNGHDPDIIPPSALVANTTAAAPEERFWYWIGALPDCPQDSPTVAGIGFPKRIETVVFDRDHGGSRVPHRGEVMALSRTKLLEIAAKVGRKVYRFRNAEVDPHNDKSTSGRRIGVALTIPTEEHKAEWKRKGFALRDYIPQHGDVPLAKYLFLVPLGAGEAPVQRPIDAVCPPTIAEVGIELPVEGKHRRAEPDELPGVGFEVGKRQKILGR